MRTRTWHWLRTRILALLDLPPAWRPDGAPVQVTRLGHDLYPPPDPKRR